MTVSNQEILDAISNMSVMDVVGLIKDMEEKFGVTAAVAQVAAPAASGEAAPKEEKTDFNVVMLKTGDSKINVIKAIRAITSLGLKEAKALAETSPAIIKESVDKATAEEIKKQLEDAGATVELQ